MSTLIGLTLIAVIVAGASAGGMRALLAADKHPEPIALSDLVSAALNNAIVWASVGVVVFMLVVAAGMAVVSSVIALV